MEKEMNDEVARYLCVGKTVTGVLLHTHNVFIERNHPQMYKMKWNNNFLFIKQGICLYILG